MSEQTPGSTSAGNTRVVKNLLFAVIAMFGFGFALVPLYDVFCDITGLNGKTTGERYVADAPTQVDTSRKIKVEFVASLNNGMPWEFEPLTYSVEVHPGEAARVEYIARNKTDEDIIGQAVPSVTPGLAAQHFQKTECFCFTEQTLKAGEEKTMPVIFMVDPMVDEDVKEITLSYTFFVKPGTNGSKNSTQTAAISKEQNPHSAVTRPQNTN